jgi:transposase
VTPVAMEATGVYWKPVWHVLEASGFELLLVNPAHFRNLPGRKTDVADSEWLAQLLECGLLRGSFIPPADIARLRDLTRYRTKIVQERVRETQRIQKLLEDAGIKLDSVASDVLGVSCRRMLEALIAGERDPAVLADMALTRMRPKIAVLQEALVGRFGDHHALLLRMHLDHVDHLAATEARLDAEVDQLMAPFAEAATRLVSIPGVGQRVAEVIVAEIGIDMSRFPTAKHLASWVGLCPGHHESAGKRRSGKTRKGNPALRSALCEAAWAAAHGTDTYLAAQFRRFKRRFGAKSETKAIFAVAHTTIVIVWHLLATGTTYNELGPDYFDTRLDTDARRRHLVRQLQALGHKVTLEPAA